MPALGKDDELIQLWKWAKMTILTLPFFFFLTNLTSFPSSQDRQAENCTALDISLRSTRSRRLLQGCGCCPAWHVQLMAKMTNIQCAFFSPSQYCSGVGLCPPSFQHYMGLKWPWYKVIPRKGLAILYHCTGSLYILSCVQWARKNISWSGG